MIQGSGLREPIRPEPQEWIGYPHHPQPKEAVNRMQKMMVAIRYLSSNAMVLSFPIIC